MRRRIIASLNSTLKADLAKSQTYRLPFSADRPFSISRQFPSRTGPVSDPSIAHTKLLTGNALSNRPDSALRPARVPSAHADSLSILDNSRPARHAHPQK